MPQTRSTLISTCALLGCAVISIPALAQSSVSLYGLADAFVGSVQSPGAHSAVVQQGGGMTTSFWGIGGTENLGGGYSTFFVLESYFQPQSGAYGRFTGDSFFSRNAYLGMTTPYGTLRAGRVTTPLYMATIQFNPFVNSYTFSPMIFQTYKGLGTQGVIGDSGWNNAVAYTSPTFAGASAGLIYSLGNTAGDNGAKKWGVNLDYTQGSFAAAAVYQYINYNSAAGDLGSALLGVPGLKSQSTAQLDASYDFKIAKVFAQYMNILDRVSSGNFSSNTGEVGASVPLGTGALLGSFAYAKSSGANSGDDRRSIWAVGYDYPLSKRTDVYTAFKYDHFSRESTGLTYGAGLRTKF